MGRASKLQGVADVALGLDLDEEEERERPHLKLTPEREEAMELWKSDPWSFLTGKDPDTGSPLVWTLDQRHKANPRRAFPAHLDYLHYLVDILEGEQYVCIEKCSQMIVTTTIALWSMWRTLTHYGHKVLLSKHKEDEAVTILREKVMEPWDNLPDWLKHQWPLRNKPSNRVECKTSKSYVLGLPENAAKADARGQTYQVGLIDEAEYQEYLGALLSAMLPRAAQVFWWSTPATGGAGVTTFKTYLADDPIRGRKTLVDLKKKYAKVKGFTTRRNEAKDVTIVRIEHTADPAKDQKWLERALRTYESSAEGRRELLIDRSTNAGRLYYPQFSEFPKRYVIQCSILPKDEPIVRGWDFGGNNPACVWGVWSRRSRRFWVLRELQGYDCDTYQFRDLVKYLSGQLSFESLQDHKSALRNLEELRFNKSYYNPDGPKRQLDIPWFNGKHKFLDFAGNEGLIGGRGLQREGDAKTAAEILGLGDIILYSRQTLHAKRTEVINGLCRVREDGHPGFLVDPACPWLWEGLTEGLVYPKPTEKTPDPTDVAPSPYSHIHDALGYAVTNMVELEDADHLKVTLGPDGQIIMPPTPDMQIASYLVGA